MKIGTRVSIPKALQSYPNDDKCEWVYIGTLNGQHRFDEYEKGKRRRASICLTEEQMKQFFET